MDPMISIGVLTSVAVSWLFIFVWTTLENRFWRHLRRELWRVTLALCNSRYGLLTREEHEEG